MRLRVNGKPRLDVEATAADLGAATGWPIEPPLGHKARTLTVSAGGAVDDASGHEWISPGILFDDSTGCSKLSRPALSECL